MGSKVKHRQVAGERKRLPSKYEQEDSMERRPRREKQTRRNHNPIRWEEDIIPEDEMDG